MKDLRTLLMDCRIELRKLVRDFHKTELCERLDVAMQALAAAPASVEADSKTASNAPAPTGREIKETSNQVALAWQMAARDLKFSNPPLYDAMSKKVMQRLVTKTLVDQVDELRELEERVATFDASKVAAENARIAIEAERDTLLGALATAVPELGDGGDRIGVALARIDWLKNRVPTAAPSRGGSSSGSRSTAAVEENPIPSAEEIASVAAGTRQFSKAQREWSVGEAMVLSGFKLTPLELIEQGDASIAKILAAAVQK